MHATRTSAMARSLAITTTCPAESGTWRSSTGSEPLTTTVENCPALIRRLDTALSVLEQATTAAASTTIRREMFLSFIYLY